MQLRVVDQFRRAVARPAGQLRRASARPANRLAIAAVGAAVAVVLVGVAVNQPSDPAGPPASAGVTTAELAPGARAATPSAPAASVVAPSRVVAPSSAAASPADAPTPAKAAPTTQAPPKPPPAKALSYAYEVQTTYYYCGPAATRIALSAMGRTPSQDDLAVRLNTTEAGTNSAVDTTRVLNAIGKGDDYVTREFPGTPSRAQIDRLRTDVVRAIGDGRPIVANIVGSQVDTEGGWHDFPGGHFLTVVGYKDNGRLLKIADPAFVNGQALYWMTTIDFANWMATRGYSA